MWLQGVANPAYGDTQVRSGRLTWGHPGLGGETTARPPDSAPASRTILFDMRIPLSVWSAQSRQVGTKLSRGAWASTRALSDTRERGFVPGSHLLRAKIRSQTASHWRFRSRRRWSIVSGSLAESRRPPGEAPPLRTDAPTGPRAAALLRKTARRTLTAGSDRARLTTVAPVGRRTTSGCRNRSCCGSLATLELYRLRAVSDGVHIEISSRRVSQRPTTRNVFSGSTANRWQLRSDDAHGGPFFGIRWIRCTPKLDIHRGDDATDDGRYSWRGVPHIPVGLPLDCPASTAVDGRRRQRRALSRPRTEAQASSPPSPATAARFRELRTARYDLQVMRVRRYGGHD